MYWDSRNDNLKFYNGELQTAARELQKFPLNIKAFNQDARDVFSMLAFVFGLDIDLHVQDFQMALAFKLRKQKVPFRFDFANIIQKGIFKEFRDYESQGKFKYLSFLAHMFLYQNPDFFSRRMQLSVVDEQRQRKPMSAWTHILSSTCDYYTFCDCFLTPILEDLSREKPYTSFSPRQVDWMSKSKNPCD